MGAKFKLDDFEDCNHTFLKLTGPLPYAKFRIYRGNVSLLGETHFWTIEQTAAYRILLIASFILKIINYSLMLCSRPIMITVFSQKSYISAFTMSGSITVITVILIKHNKIYIR